MKEKVRHAERTSTFYSFRNILSACLVVLAMCHVLLKEWPSSINFEYPVIAIIFAPVSVPGIGSIILLTFVL